MRWTPVFGGHKLLFQRKLVSSPSSTGMLAVRFARPKTHNNARMLHFFGSRWNGTASNPIILQSTTRTKKWTIPIGASAFTVLIFGLTINLNLHPVHAEEPQIPNLAKIRLSEVREHGVGAKSIWVTKGTNVYDITEWIESHPGGEVILRAAGGSIDPYWKIFTIHQKQDVYDILESYLIGTIDPLDLDENGNVPANSIVDPFQTDPARDPRLLVHSNRPCNAETPARELGTFLTPNSLFYVRNHLWVPDISEPDTHKLTIELLDGEEKTYTLTDLRARFKEHKITSTLQCSGNRRAHMSASKSTNGLQWDVGAIGTAEWSGCLLRDVLADAGVDINPPASPNPLTKDTSIVKHAQFVGAEAYGASIPISKALSRDGDVLLAWGMNGEPLPRDHGFPLRVVVPGTVAARSVKWLSRIVLSPYESTSQWQRRDYKCFGPNVPAAKVDWEKGKSIQETPVQSAVTFVQEVNSHTPEYPSWGSGRIYWLDEDYVTVEGYAYSGGGREIVRVDVSADGGRTWMQAELQGNCEGDAKEKGDARRKGSRCWTWKRWKCDVPKMQAAMGREFVVKAVDDSYNTQPENYAATWNFRGNLTTAWHRVEYIPKKEVRSLAP
ncbi:MAG: hypothetical protein M1820_010184 [Bogoriella megaspora]|nr:MAG: hypothetical protein M1820_010184 [Bogoriella megaspora]